MLEFVRRYRFLENKQNEEQQLINNTKKEYAKSKNESKSKNECLKHKTNVNDKMFKEGMYICRVSSRSKKLIMKYTFARANEIGGLFIDENPSFPKFFFK